MASERLREGDNQVTKGVCTVLFSHGSAGHRSQHNTGTPDTALHGRYRADNSL